jgi:hypothetical protein
VALLERKGENDVAVIARAAGIGNPKRIYVMRKQIRGKPPALFLRLLGQLLEVEADLKRGADPGDAGTMSTSEIAYTSYARQNVARSTGWTSSSAGSTNPAANIDFTTGTGGSGSATFFSTGKSGGGAAAILFSGAVSPAITTGDGITPRLTTATAITLD